MIGVGFKILTPTPVPKLPRVPPPTHTQRSGIWLGLVSKYWLPHPYQNYPESPPHTHNYRGYERAYKFKEQYMNRLTVCEIKYMNRLGFFQSLVYDWGWFQSTDSHTHTNITRPPPPPPSVKLVTFCLCKLSSIIFLLPVVLIMLNGWDIT